MCEAAARMCAEINYASAGTLLFVLMIDLRR